MPNTPIQSRRSGRFPFAALARRSIAPARGLGALYCLSTFVAGVAMADDRVTITGGVDRSGQNYEWKVKNNSTVPIVFIEFPHYHADMFNPPAGWDSDCTNLAKAESTPGPGVCRATARPDRGISPGRSATFEMRLSRAGANRRPGNVRVRFADNTEVLVGGVELPTAPTQLGQYQMLMGLAAVFVIMLLINARRRKKKIDGPDVDAPPSEDGSA